MSTDPAQLDITIRQGRYWSMPVIFVDPVYGRQVSDLVITDGSSIVTSETGFTSADDGQLIVTLDGTGIDDGTTLTVIDPTTAQLSAAATGTGTVVAAVAPLDASAWSNHRAQFRRWRSTESDTDPVDFAITTAREQYGAFALTLDDAVTDLMKHSGKWEWAVDDADGHPMPLYEGDAEVILKVAAP